MQVHFKGYDKLRKRPMYSWLQLAHFSTALWQLFNRKSTLVARLRTDSAEYLDRRTSFMYFLPYNNINSAHANEYMQYIDDIGPTYIYTHHLS